MLDTLLAKVFGTENERELKRMQPLVAEISAREAGIRARSDEQLRQLTVEFREKVAQLGGVAR